LKKIAIVQSNYIPWKGYFDLIAAVDEFILLDDAQYTRRDWRNRNKIKTPQGIQWLSVPIIAKGKFTQKIHEAEIYGNEWATLHWKTLTRNYSQSAHFKELAEWLEPSYLSERYSNLSELNRKFILTICNYLEIKTQITNSSDYQLEGDKTERLVNLCIQAGGQEYVSGPAAKSYLEEELFHQKQVGLTWFNYDSYPEYPQLWGKFVHNVTVLDLLFNCGKKSVDFMRYVL
jgi:hypothetical protein